MLKSLDSVGYVNWVTHLRTHLSSNSFGYVWEAQGTSNEKCFMSEYVQRLKDQYIQTWMSNCINSAKLQLYAGYKLNFETEPYVNYLCIRKFRNVYTRKA